MGHNAVRKAQSEAMTSTTILIASNGFARIIPGRVEAALIADLRSIVSHTKEDRNEITSQAFRSH